MKKSNAFHFSLLFTLVFSLLMAFPAQGETVAIPDPVLVAEEPILVQEEEGSLLDGDEGLETELEEPVVPTVEEGVAAPNLVVSDWAIETVSEAQMMGLIPMDTDMVSTDFTAPVSSENMQMLSARFQEKIKESALALNTAYKDIEVAQNATRQSVVFQVYRDAAPYAPEVHEETQAIPYLVENGILRGRGDDDYALEEVASYEEAITFYTRAIKDLYADHDLGGKGYFYKVENDGNVAYLFGSIHVGNAGMYPLNAKVLDAFESSDTLYVELNLMDPKVLEETMLYSFKTDGSTLEDEIGPELYERVKKVMDDMGAPEESYASMEGWILLNNLSTMPILMEDPYAVTRAIDLYFLTHANLQRKEVVALETVDLQMKVLKDFYGSNREALLTSLDQVLTTFETEGGFAEAFADLKAMQDAWTLGDADAMMASFEEDPSSKILLVDRDPLMAEKIKAFLMSEDKGTSFIVVGAGHYLSDQSVLYYLEESGFQVEKLTAA